jgi:DNA replication protein DnaC
LDDLLTRARALLRQLGLLDALNVLEASVPADPAQRVAALGVMARVLQEELDRRRERRIERRLKASQLPERPTLAAFDFDFQPTLDRALVMDLATLAWVGRREDLVLIGQSGTGKSHIAKALCVIGCSQERRVRYTTCADMLSELHASLADGSLRETLKAYTRPELLLIDDLGYDTIEQEQARDAQLLYKVLDARHGVASTIITSNLEAERWADYLGNPYVTVALLDRLLFHATAITINGPSYRLAAHRERQRGRSLDAASSQPDASSSHAAS